MPHSSDVASFVQSVKTSCCLAGLWQNPAKRLKVPLRQQSSRHLVCNEHGDSPLDQYKMGKKVGAGAFGVVRKVSHRNSCSECVMKTLKIEMMPDVNALRNEIELHADLDHPHVVRIFEHFDDDDHVHIVMESCEGGDLENALNANGEDEMVACAVMIQIMRAIKYLHCRMIVHRDIKPDNFMVKEEWVPLRDNVLKLIDFGMATRINAEKRLTTICGTPEYMAPEIFGDNPYDEKCDVYSCGIILHQVLCGKTPFDSDDVDEIIAKAQKGTLCLTGLPWDSISGKAKLLVSQMCVKSPSRRLSAEQVLNSTWLQDACRSDNPTLTPDASRNIKCFGRSSTLKKIALHKVAYYLSDEKITKYREAFLQIDTNNDGTITLEEVQSVLVADGMSPDEVRELFEKADSDHSGCIDYSEFLAATVSQEEYLDEQACREAFASFDRDGSGSISLKELEAALSDGSLAGAKLNESRIREMLKEVDRDGDGTIDFEEFVETLRGG